MSNFFGLTDAGRMRDNNEDAFIAQKILKDQYVLACVIDGVGGYEGGEVAAQLAKENILSYFSIPSGDIATMMKEALMVANEKIYEEKQKGQNGSMACVLTMAVADVEKNKFYYAHIGDTRLYLFRDNSLVKITRDHSFVGFLEDTGRLSEAEAMSHPKRNEINKALGFDPQMRTTADYLETGESPFLPGDILLLCSDGLSDMVNAKEITSVLAENKTLEQKAKKLIEAANEAGGKDNITVALVYNNSKATRQKATKPVLVKKNVQPAEEPLQKETEQPVRHSGSDPGKPTERKKYKNNNGLIIFLVLLCLVLLFLLLWPYLKNKTQPSQNIVSIHNPREQKLADTLDHIITDSLVLSSVVNGTMGLTDTLIISKDSLIMIGNNQLVLRADSNFKGPAIVISPACEYVSLENITFENFDVAIISTGRALHLKNVSFKNCGVGVLQGFSFLDSSYVNGYITDTSFFKTDSLAK
jgi:serine/threonine protein phosphatase PrpC